MEGFVGIDYSMSSPAICAHSEIEWNFNNCKFFFLASRKTVYNCHQNFKQTPFFKDYWTCNEERFDMLSNWAINCIHSLHFANCKVYIEHYAFASKGLVYHIGENGGLLKHKIYKASWKYDTVPPKTIKKFATGKGNADKQLMYEAFLDDTKFDMVANFGVNSCEVSPINDLVDAYFICKYAHTYG